jgi:hypothetical protein
MDLRLVAPSGASSYGCNATQLMKEEGIAGSQSEFALLLQVFVWQMSIFFYSFMIICSEEGRREAPAILLQRLSMLKKLAQKLSSSVTHENR